MFAVITNLKPLFCNFWLLNIANRRAGTKRPLTLLAHPGGALFSFYSAIVDEYNAEVEQYNAGLAGEAHPEAEQA